MSQRSIARSTGFAVALIVLVIALGNVQSPVAQASGANTAQVQNGYVDEGSTLQGYQSSCQAPLGETALVQHLGAGQLTEQGQGQGVRAAPLEYICCAWVYWCDYYACYYVEDCWYCY
jgi:hypothetical protein